MTCSQKQTMLFIFLIWPSINCETPITISGATIVIPDKLTINFSADVSTQSYLKLLGATMSISGTYGLINSLNNWQAAADENSQTNIISSSLNTLIILAGIALVVKSPEIAGYFIPTEKHTIKP